MGIGPPGKGSRTSVAVGHITRGAPPAEREVVLSVRGMTCGSCAARLEHRLGALSGAEASVNYATQRARVHTSMPVAALLDEVRAAGFTAREVRGSDRAADEIRAEADRRAHALGSRLVVAGLLLMPLCDASIAFSVVPSLRFPGWQWPLVVLALPVVTWCAWPFYQAAGRQALHGVTSMDTLASLGILAATGWSVYAMFWINAQTGFRPLVDALIHPARGAIYLDVAAAVTTFLLAGRYVEARSRRRAASALGGLAALGAKQVTIVADDGTERACPVSEMMVGDLFLVRPGETVAADGTVVGGQAVLDRSTMTGESIPTEVTMGDSVVGGTVALGGHLVVRADAVGEDTQLAHMVQLVERAQNEKAASQRLADRVAAVFVPAVVALSLCTLCVWLLATADAEQAVNAALSVLIIACPCALGLATPMALLMASDRGTRSGIFFKGYEAIEMSGRIDTVLLDKTGTVTEARMSVAGVAATAGWDEPEVLRMAAVVERPSEHPIGRSIAACGQGEGGPEPSMPEDFRSLAGLGVQGVVNGSVVSVGALGDTDPMPVMLLADVRRWRGSGHTVVAVHRDGRIVGAIAVADTLRSGAPAAVSVLRQLDLDCVLLTGDNGEAAHSVATRCAIDTCVAGASPQDKAAVIRQLQEQGHRVAMVGDGVNDAPALAAADLGLALGSGTDIARNTSDLLIVRNDLAAVPTAIALARRTHLTIRRNLAWAFGYNLVALPLAACGLLNPLIAAAAMALSSGFVVWNSARLRHFADPVPTRQSPGAA